MDKPFQFRLITLFAVIAIVCWGMVVVPHWIKVYPEQRRIQKERDLEIDRLNLANTDSPQQYRAWPSPPQPKEVDVMPIVMVGASIVAILTALGVFLWLNNRPPSVPKN